MAGSGAPPPGKDGGRSVAPSTEEPREPPATARRLRLLAIALLLLFAARTALSARRHSVTVDEYAHLPAGLAHLAYRDFRVDPRNPPLARAFEAIPALLARPALPFEDELAKPAPDAWALGDVFQAANADRYVALYDRARLAATLLGTLLGLLLYLWSRRIWGEKGGAASAAFLAFEPNLVAHAGLVTTDVAFCLAAIVALRSSARTIERRGAGSVALAGLALGAALLTKHTALLLFPSVLATVLLAARPVGPALRRFAAASLLSVLVLDAGYLFTDVGRPLGSFEFESEAFRRLPTLPVPVPLPGNWVRGLDGKALDEQGAYPTYLNGRLYGTGAPWGYDLEVLALKTPLGELALLLLAGILLARLARGPARVAATLGASTAVFLLLAASRSSLNLGVRYLLLLYPLGALLVGGLAFRAPRLVLAGLALQAVESALSFPNEIGFFNTAAGGASGGRRFLAESNLDWGQDLPALRRILEEKGIPRVRLAYFGQTNPRLYGIDYELPKEPFGPGWYAISANHLVGLPCRIRDYATGEARWTRPGEFDRFRGMRPVARAGVSILLYRIEG